MYQKIPEDKLKAVVISDNVFATGYKSTTYAYGSHHEDPKLNNDLVSVIIKSGSFKLDIHGRESLLKLKEALDFALEIEKEDNNE